MGAINLSKQTVNLSKGETINLSKASEGLKEVMVGMGWDPVKVGFLQRLFGEGSRFEYDLDVYIVMLRDGSFSGNRDDIVFYNNLQYRHNGMTVIKHHGDNLTGRGAAGDKEQISINLAEIPKKFNELIVAVTLYQGVQRHQSLGVIKNMFVRVVDKADDFELCNFRDKGMTEDFNAQSFVVGRFFREGGEWQFGAIGKPTRHGSVGELAESYR